MIEPLELITIAIIAIVIFMFGPKKIPELARSIGLARKEFNDASALASGKETAPKAVPAVGSQARRPSATTGDPLLDAAKRMGLQTEGKSREEISIEIVSRA